MPKSAALPPPARPRPRRSPWQWVRAFFSHQLRLRRGPRGLSFVLEASTPEPQAAAAVEKKAAPADMRTCGAR
jgi:hypothetical protein